MFRRNAFYSIRTFENWGWGLHEAQFTWIGPNLRTHIQHKIKYGKVTKQLLKVELGCELNMKYQVHAWQAHS